MRRLAALAVAAVTLAGLAAAPASATECTPRGCTTACRLILERPFVVCYS